MTAKEYLSSYIILTTEIEQLRMEQQKEANKKREKEIATKIAARNKIIATIHSLKNSVQEKILYKHFIEDKSYNVIADEIHYSKAHIMREKKKALIAVDSLIGN